MMFSSSASGAESLITTSKTYAELNPVIAVDGSGNYVVVWSNDGQDVGEWGVYGQRFNASGTPVGSEFLINQTPVGEQPHPAVAMNASGSFVVSWTSRENNGGICAREYDSSGTPTGNAFLVATNRAGVQENSAVAIDSAGDVVVTWEGEGPGDTQGIFSRTYLSGNLPGTGLSTDTPSEVVQTNKSAIVTQRFAPTAATTNSQTAGPTKTTEHVDSKVARSTAIVFIDTSVPDWQLLVTGVHEAAPDDQVVLIDPTHDGIAQITQALAGRTGITAIHLFTHGDMGELQIGNVLLNAGNLDTYAASIKSWRQSLAPGADLLLYGCDVAKGSIGKTFVNKLAQLSDAAVAASTDLSGQKALGGNWKLEYDTGAIRTPVAISRAVKQDWAGTLLVFPPTASNDQYTVTANQTLTVAAPGVLSNDTDFLDSPLTAIQKSAPAHGSLSLNSSGAFQYIPNAGYSGTDSFTYQATDGILTSNTATVTITVNAPPTVAAAASATPNPVTGKTTALSVLGADAVGEANLTYTWATTGTPPAAVSFSANGTNAAKNTTATFSKAGTYNFTVTITNSAALATTSTVSVTVNQLLTTLVVSPSSITLNENTTKQFTAIGYDQFDVVMATQPALTWSNTGVGSIDAGGLYTAPGSGSPGSATITAGSGSIQGTASVTATNATPTVATPASAAPSAVTGTTTALSVLGADDGGESNLTYTWATTGSSPAGVTFSANGTNVAKSTTATFAKAGTYNFKVTITDAGGLATTSSVAVTVSPVLTTIVVNPGTASLHENTTQQFTAVAYDQFGVALATQPSFTWSSTGVGTTNTTGLYAAPGSGSPGLATITAGSGAVSGMASIIVTNAAPTVATAAAASPNSVTGTSTSLSVLGADDGGQTNLTYTWLATGVPPAPVAFSANATNGAKSTTATFAAAGTYTLQVTITDAGGLTATSSVTVQVQQTAASILITPASPSLPANNFSQFTATEEDQFGKPISSQPGINWSLSGGGTLSNTGLYLAPATAGTPTVTATAGPISGSTSISIGAQGPSIVPAGSESLVNSASTNGNQQLPAVAMDQAGNFVVVWEDGSNGGNVNAQLYNASGAAVGNQFQVNTAAAGGTPDPSVAMDATGQFVVCWNGKSNSVYAKVFDATGTALTGDTLVTANEHSNSPPAVGMAADGSFTVAYEGNDTADNDGIYIQRFTAAGVASGGDILVNTTTSGAQINPSIATDPQGGSVVAWTDKSSGQTIKAALLPASGSPSAEIIVGTSGGNNEDLSSVGIDGAGNFVVAWADNGPTQGIYTRRYNAAGVPLDAAPVQFDDPGAASQTKPAVAMRLDGSYLVAWTAGNNLDGNANGVFAQAFNADGSANGGQFLVNTTTQGNQQDAAAAWYNGNLVIAWDGQGVGDNQGVFEQLYTFQGVPNVAPTVTVPSAQTVTEGGSLTLSTAMGNAFSATDSDNDGGVEQVSLSATNGTLTLASGSEVDVTSGTGAGDSSVTFTGTISDLNLALDGLVFTPAPDVYGAGSIAISIDDLGNSGSGGALSAGGSVSITINPIAHTPTATPASTNENTPSTSGLVITSNPLDDLLTGYYQITGITGGSLFQYDGTTAITDGQFITFAQGEAGLRFAPPTNSTASGTFDVQASTSGNSAGLGGSVVADSITVNPVPLLSAPVSAATNEDTSLTFAIAGGDAITVSDPGNSGGVASVTLAAADGTFTLASTSGLTISAGAASGSSGVTFTGSFANLNAALNGLQFLPATHFSGSTMLAISVSEGANSAGGSMAIAVAPVAHTPGITNATTIEDQQTTSGLVVSLNPLDGAAAGFIQVTSISGGTLFQNDGMTVIQSGDFITTAQATAGLRFTPTSGSLADGSFDVQASTSSDVSGLGGSVVGATVTVVGLPRNQVPGAQSTNEDTALVFNSSRLISVSDPSIGAGNDIVTLTATNGSISLAGGSGVTIINGSGTDDTTVSLTGSLLQLNAALSNLVFTPSTHYSGPASLQIVTTDPANTDSNGPLSASSTVAINVLPIAHTPSITFAQTIETAQTASGLVITPNPLDASLGGFFQIGAITNGTLHQADGMTPITSGQFITFAQGAAGLKFTPDAGSTVTGSFTVRASTTADASGLGGGQITGVIAITRKPTLTIEPAPLSFTERSAPQAISPMLTISQPNGRLITGATVRLNGYVAGQDALQFVNQNGITGSWDSAASVLTLTGTAAAATYQSALESVAYFNSSQDPSQTAHSAQFVVTDALFSSISATRQINVIPVNNAPTIAAPQSQSTVEDVPLAFSTSLGSGITLADVDSEGKPEQVTLTATNGTLATSYAPNAPASTITLTAPLNSLNAALDGMIFTPSPNYFGPASITISINDLGNTGTPGPRSASMTIPINVAPVAHTPRVTNADVEEGHRSDSGLVITPNSADESLVGYYQITDITGGALLQNNGVTPINDGDFITFAQGQAGLLFTPTAGSLATGAFVVQASVSNSVAGLGGNTVQATISVVAAPLVVQRASLELENEPVVPITTASLYVISPVDAAEDISYTVLSLPQHGTLLLDGAPLQVNGSFTRADVDGGGLSYAPLKGVALPDSFQFQANDAMGRTTGTAIFHIKPQPIPITPLPPVTPSPAPASGPDQNSNLPDSIVTITPSQGSTSTQEDGQNTVPAPAANPVNVPTPPGKSAVPAQTPAAHANPAPKGGAGSAQKTAVATATPSPTSAPAYMAASNVERESVARAEIVTTRTLLARNSRMWVDLDAMKQNMHSEIRVWAGTASFVSIGMSLAYFVWIFRAGSLISSVLSSMPAWNFVDPLPILESMGSGSRRHEDDEGLEGLLKGSKKQ
jgi:VCBS repeat-containing protein